MSLAPLTEVEKEKQELVMEELIVTAKEEREDIPMLKESVDSKVDQAKKKRKISESKARKQAEMDVLKKEVELAREQIEYLKESLKESRQNFESHQQMYQTNEEKKKLFKAKPRLIFN